MIEPAAATVAGPFLVIDRSATGVMVVDCDPLLFAPFASPAEEEIVT